jgi:hypothetical protein
MSLENFVVKNELNRRNVCSNGTEREGEGEKNGCLTQSRSTLWHCCCNLINA